MDLRVLRYFLTVAREGNISSAASRLGVTQPTLSRQLQELESEFHIKLFNRGCRGRTLTLTEKGAILRHRAEEILLLSDGKIAECGSHEELMEQKGKYYELFLVQSKYYGEGGAADVD